MNKFMNKDGNHPTIEQSMHPSKENSAATGIQRRNKVLSVLCVLLYIFLYLYLCIYCMTGDYEEVYGVSFTGKMAAPLYIWIILSVVLIGVFLNLIGRAKDSNLIMGCQIGDIILTCLSLPVAAGLTGSGWIVSLFAVIFALALIFGLSFIIVRYQKRKNGEER
ncbi:MAG: hypothetical protein LUD73_06110 [Lachnospiraceae bacterium]|nr:hypothetical protein [Lachnospiraceae bacterium]